MIDRRQNIWWLWMPAPGRPDPTPAWEGGSKVVFATWTRSSGRSPADRPDPMRDATLRRR
jgi:hypothetical protein